MQSDCGVALLFAHHLLDDLECAILRVLLQLQEVHGGGDHRFEVHKGVQLAAHLRDHISGFRLHSSKCTKEYSLQPTCGTAGKSMAVQDPCFGRQHRVLAITVTALSDAGTSKHASDPLTWVVQCRTVRMEV